MAKYEHLPIYKQSYSLLVEFHKIVPKFPKKYKFSIGSEIISDLTNNIIKIIEINSASDKKPLFDELIRKSEKIKIQIRILKSLEVISKKQYFDLSGRILQIIKQSEGWKSKFIS